MHPLRRRRLLAAVLLLCGSAAVTALVLYALRENINLFYPPADFVAGEVPTGRMVRLGGMVLPGSLQRQGVQMRFRVGDSTTWVPVLYSGLAPELFGEGRGVVATGIWETDGVFHAASLLAKHDENYRPPEEGMP